MKKYRHVRNWVEDLPRLGRFSFSLDEAREQFNDMPVDNIRNALHRLSVAGKILSVWRGFYAVVLPEYGLDGSVPPAEYIDQLMSYVNADYYVALLSAASYQGAAQQSPQVFQVISNRQIRSKDVSGTHIEFVYKKDIPKTSIEQKTVKSGCIDVSKPALTALDLVGYPSRSGGISRVASVIADLADSIDFSTIEAGVLKQERSSTVQRLGHLLETVLNEKELADTLFDKCVSAGLLFRRVGLVPNNDDRHIGYDKKWMITINYEVEVDG